MATFHFDLVSPERVLYSGEVEQVDLPGFEGDFGVLAGHAPLVAMLRAGVVKINPNSGGERIAVRGGFAEFASDVLTVLADRAVPVAEIDATMLAQAIKDAEEDLADATDDAARSDAHRRLEQLALLKETFATER
jgi:F-type H+-transporting ATPase subunit epsilon